MKVPGIRIIDHLEPRDFILQRQMLQSAEDVIVNPDFSGDIRRKIAQIYISIIKDLNPLGSP